MANAKLVAINSAANGHDDHYRYKRETLIVQHIGNRAITLLLNVPSIAKSLGRDVSPLISFIGKTMRTRTWEWDKKNTTDDKRCFAVAGIKTAKELEDTIESFIGTYVCCHTCCNPETNMSIEKGKLVLRCRSCGAKSRVSGATDACFKDLNDLKAQRKAHKKTPRAESKAPASAAAVDGDGDGDGGCGCDDDDDAVIWTADTSPEAVARRAALVPAVLR